METEKELRDFESITAAMMDAQPPAQIALRSGDGRRTTETPECDNVTPADFTQSDLNALDGGALVATAEAEHAEITYQSRTTQKRLRGRLLPVLREIRDRIKAGLTIGGCTGFPDFLLSIGIRPGTFRKWEQREREALRQDDSEEFQPPPEKHRPAATPIQNEGQDHQAGVLKTCSRIISAGLKSLAKKSHPDTGGATEDMQALNEAAELLRKFMTSSTAQ